MCGIAGIMNLGDRPSPTRGQLEAMVAQLRHRGPEGEGYLRNGQIGLAHARLSIIDIEGGAQPISNEQGTIWVVLNGEIFNYLELRSELSGRGHRFKTNTDTEVIVHLYEDLGEEFVHRLNGQFAIGIWDSERARLVLVRDRVGIVPLFFSRTPGRLIFASEIKGLLPILGKPELDPVALDELMTVWSPVSPRTVFRGVEELPPGHVLRADGEGVKVRQYWDWVFPQSGGGYLSGTEDALAAELREILLDATRIRLRADVPVGAYLSGGLDSSTLVSLIHKVERSELRTFSIAFDSEELDESRFQRMMIELIGADHSELRCSLREVADHFKRTIFHTESPLLRTAPTPMMLLSRLVKEGGFKVVLTGEGADEALGGYDLFKEAKVRWFWARRPDSRWRPLLLKRLYPYLDLPSMRAEAYLKRFFEVGIREPDSPVFSHLPRWETGSKAKMFFSSSFRERVERNVLETVVDSIPSVVEEWDPFNRAQYIEAKFLLPGYLLSSQGDRMLMANGVEGRFPFLDHRLIEFSNRLDPRLKMKVLREKHLLRRALSGILPEPILERAKHPYRAPEAETFFHGGRAATPYVEDLLSEQTISDYGYFDPDKVRLLTKKARSGAATGAGNSQALVGILSTQIWHHLFIERYDSDFAVAPRG